MHHVLDVIKQQMNSANGNHHTDDNDNYNHNHVFNHDDVCSIHQMKDHTYNHADNHNSSSTVTTVTSIREKTTYTRGWVEDYILPIYMYIYYRSSNRIYMMNCNYTNKLVIRKFLNSGSPTNGPTGCMI